MTSEYKHTFNFHTPVKSVRWWRVVSCIALVMVLCTALASAGVVKSKGVKRIVDGPHGEVVVDSVLDNTGVPLVEESPQAFDSSVSEAAPPPTKEQVLESNNQIQYKEPEMNPDDFEKKDNHGLLKIILVGVLILALGGGVVVYMNKRA